jgi:hypothetical protein
MGQSGQGKPLLYNLQHEGANLLTMCTGEHSIKEINEYRYSEDAGAWENTMAQLAMQGKEAKEARPTDEDFPEDASVLGKASSGGWMIQWIPAAAVPTLNGVPADDICLYGSMQSMAMLEGAKNVWLVASLAALLDQPQLVLACFPNQGPAAHPRGEYTLRLFDPDQNFAECEIEINDLVPMTSHAKRGTEADNWTPLMARPLGPEIYMMLLEKGVAKLLGGYDALEQGTTLYAWSILTGAEECYSIQKEQDENGAEEWSELEVTDVSWAYGYRGSVTENYDDTSLLSRVMEADRNGALIGVSVGTAGSVHPQATTNPVLASGLVAGHVYGVRQIVQAEVTLVQLRNPWHPGNVQKVWKGAYGVGAPQWASADGSRLASQVGYAGGADGFFWMSWEDFCANWDTVLIANLPKAK